MLILTRLLAYTHAHTIHSLTRICICLHMSISLVACTFLVASALGSTATLYTRVRSIVGGKVYCTRHAQPLCTCIHTCQNYAQTCCTAKRLALPCTRPVHTYSFTCIMKLACPSMHSETRLPQIHGTTHCNHSASR